MSTTVRNMTIFGDNDYTLIAEEQEWSRENGYRTVKRYSGPIDKLDTLFDGLVNDPSIDSLSKTTENASGIVEVRYYDDDGSGGGLSTEGDNVVWEVIGQQIYKPLRSFNGSDLGTVDFTTATQTTLEVIRRKWELGQLDETSEAAGVTRTYAEMLARGRDEYIRSAVILRSTLPAGRRSQLEASWVGVDKAWKFVGEAGSPDISGPAGTTIIGNVSAMPEFNSAKKQWLKLAPQVRWQGRRATIVQEWWFARLWSYNFYLGDAESGNP